MLVLFQDMQIYKYFILTVCEEKYLSRNILIPIMEISYVLDLGELSQNTFVLFCQIGCFIV